MTARRNNTNLASETRPASQTATLIAGHFESARSSRNSSVSRDGYNNAIIPPVVENQMLCIDDSVHSPIVPTWSQELANSRVGRQSRASSVFSTRTRLSAMTLDDARSIEIDAGGHTFRINRDGSRIVDVTAPPPYPGSPNLDIPHFGAVYDQAPDETSPVVLDVPNREDTVTPRAVRDPQEADSSDLVLPERSSEIPPGLFEVPERRTHASGITRGTADSPSTTSGLNVTLTHPRRTQSDTPGHAWFRSWTRPSITSGTDNREVGSPDSRGSLVQDGSAVADIKQSGCSRFGGNFTASMSTPSQTPNGNVEDPHEDDLAAEIRNHYIKMMRDLNQSHRIELMRATQELSRLREMVNEKDIVYRQQLRDRDLMIDDMKAQIHQQSSELDQGRHQMEEASILEQHLRQRIDLMNGELETKMEHARNEVEGIWEQRWKQHEALLVDLLRRKDPTS